MRTFIAIELAPDVLACIGEMAHDLEKRLAGARFVPVDNLHLTLRFLGYTKEETLERIRAGLAKLAAPVPPFRLKFRGIGFFPTARRPRVLWVGTEDVPDPLRSLQERVEALAVECGLEPESRPFSPHITLARFKTPRLCAECPDLVAALASTALGESLAEALTLFESRLSPSGARYRPLARSAFLAGN